MLTSVVCLYDFCYCVIKLFSVVEGIPVLNLLESISSRKAKSNNSLKQQSRKENVTFLKRCLYIINRDILFSYGLKMYK